MSELKEGILLGLGNPLLDITCNVEQDLLDKYGLKANDVILADESHSNLSKEIISNFECGYIAGGSVQNTLRAVQWMLNKPNCMTFMGAIGDDHFGKVMADKSKEEGLNAVYMIDKDVPTGTCACLISKNNTCRSLVAYLGASQKFRLDHLVQNSKYVEKANFFYASGFHLVVSVESVMHLAHHAHSNQGKLFSLNLSAPYISQAFSKPLLEVFPFVDLLFGNETEAEAFAQLNGWQTKDMKKIAKLIADMECKRKSGRTVIITQGKDHILVAYTISPDVKQFEVNPIDESKIVDTNGAGDSFVGGFFAQLVQNKSLDVCIESGIYCAQEVIQQMGTNFPKEMKFKN